MKPREFWIDDWGDAYPSIVELWKKTKHGPIIHVIEHSAYESLKAQNEINRMAAENGTKRIAELEAKDKWQSEHMGKLSQDVFSLLEQLNSERARSAKLVEALKSMHIDTCGWDLETLDVEIARAWHKLNNEKIEAALAEHEKEGIK